MKGKNIYVCVWVDENLSLDFRVFHYTSYAEIGKIKKHGYPIIERRIYVKYNAW